MKDHLALVLSNFGTLFDNFKSHINVLFFFSVGRNSGRKSGRPRLPATSPHFNKGKSDMISYEDLLVAQYLDELKRHHVDQPKDKAQ